MTTGLVLIAAILVLGGVIATVGDRIGMKVGKSRLSLFKLRPRQTATLITVMTGIVISASTFGILFAIDDQLRTGVFELGDIQQDLSSARSQLEQARNEKDQIVTERDTALKEQDVAEKRLARINQSLKQAIAQQERTEQQAARLRQDIEQLTANREREIAKRDREIAARNSEIQQLQANRQQELAQRDREIAARNAMIAQRTQEIEEREMQLRDLENQRSLLVQEVLNLGREFQGLRQGNVALLRNQPLAAGVARIVEPGAATEAVDQLLREANRVALLRIRPGTNNVNQQVIQIPNDQVEQLVNQIRDGKDYVLRIISAGNYVVGEPCVLAGTACVRVYAVAAPNQIVFREGEVVAATTADSSRMNPERLAERINFLIAAAQFRVQQAGILADSMQVADGTSETVGKFFERLQQYKAPVDLQAVTIANTYTAGPVRLELIASQNGQVIFSTLSPAETGAQTGQSPQL